MTLASGSGGDVEVGIDEDVIDDENDTTTVPETETEEEENDDTSTTIPTTTPTTSTPITNNGATPLKMEVNTPTLLDMTWRPYDGKLYFISVFSNNQTLLGSSINEKGQTIYEKDKSYLLYSSTSIEIDIQAATNNLTQIQYLLATWKKDLKKAEADLKKEKKKKKPDQKTERALEKKIKDIKEAINRHTSTTIQTNSAWLQELLMLKPQVLSMPKIIATNSHAAQSVTQSGSTGNQIELYRFTLQTDLPPVSVVDRIVFEVHSSSSSVSFVDGSLQLVEKSSLKPVLSCSQKQDTKRIIDCQPITCINGDRDCQPVLRDNQPREYILVGKLISTVNGSYAINKIDGIIYNALNYRYYSTDIVNNTRPFQTVFTTGQ